MSRLLAVLSVMMIFHSDLGGVKMIDFDKLQIDIIKDTANMNADMWKYYCGDEGKVLMAPRRASALFIMPSEECKLVLERVADRYEALWGYFQNISKPEEMAQYKKMVILGTVKPFANEVMYKLIDEGRNFYVYLFPKWLRYVDLMNVEILSKDSESPVIIKYDGEIVQIVAPLRINYTWGL